MTSIPYPLRPEAIKAQMRNIRFELDHLELQLRVIRNKLEPLFSEIERQLPKETSDGGN